MTFECWPFLVLIQIISCNFAGESSPVFIILKRMTDMKRNWIFGTLAVVVLLTILVVFIKDDNFLSAKEQPVNEDITSTQPGGSDINNDYPKDIRLTESQRKMCENNNDFACNLFRTIYKQKKDNRGIIVSPISVSYLLGMLNEGADGETRRQITDVLGLDGSTVEEINKYFKKMMDETPIVDTKVIVKTANCIDVNSAKEIRLIPQYETDMQQYYNAQIDALDFTQSSSLDKINNWCKTHTDGMIPNILKKHEFNPPPAMILVNAVYFKGLWAKEFNPKETKDKYFAKQDGTIVKHKMMHLKTRAAYGENDLCKMLRLPYGNGGYSMVVLLPHKGKTIHNVIQSLSAQKLEQHRHMTIDEVDILMPRFSTESVTYLEHVLSSMGMPLAFGMSAEFPNMAQGHIDDLYVSKMKQKAKIEVVEEGTKAAAVTVVQMELKEEVVAEQGPTAQFHATRPFVYYIIENSTGTILFMGTYCGENGGEKVNIQNIDEENEIVVASDHGKKEKRSEDQDKIYRSAEQMPQFPGGETALMKYLKMHINYPPMAKANKIQGRVIVQFVVDKTGKVGEVKVVRSVDKDLDEEAVRLIKTLPKFTPGRQNRKAVDVWYTVPVIFKLP